MGKERSIDCAGLHGSGRQFGCQRQILHVSRVGDDDDDDDVDDDVIRPWNACYHERLDYCVARIAVPEFDPSETDDFMIVTPKNSLAHLIVCRCILPS